MPLTHVADRSLHRKSCGVHRPTKWLYERYSGNWTVYDFVSKPCTCGLVRRRFWGAVVFGLILGLLGGLFL